MSMSSTIDAVVSSAPINRTAARVTSKGFDYQPNKRVVCIEGDLPLPVRQLAPGEEDLRGKRVGRLTVIGRYAGGNGLWVVRCDCSRYATRKTKALKNQNNYGDRCEQCRHISYLKRMDIWRSTGKEVDARDL